MGFSLSYANDICPDCASESTLKEIQDTLKKKPKIDDKPSDDIYKKNTEKTYSSVFLDFKSRVSAAPISGAVGQFFSYNSGGSDCPVWDINAWAFYLRLDHFCSDLAFSVYPIASFLVSFAASFMAFRWAFLDK